MSTTISVLDNLSVIRNVPRQRELHTCGPAAVAACVFVLAGHRYKESLIYEICQADPEVGTTNERIVNALSTSLNKRIIAGEYAWQGGLAVANIRNPISGRGHYVVLLGKDSEQGIRFYDPYWGHSLQMPEHEIKWQSGDEQWSHWCANVTDHPIVSNMIGESIDNHPAGDVCDDWKLTAVQRRLNKSKVSLDHGHYQRRCILGGTCGCLPSQTCSAR